MSDLPKLIQLGVGQRGMTELHYAAYCGDSAALNRCLAAGADANHVDQYLGYTALHWLADMAAAGGDDRAEMAEVLLRHDADPEIRSSNNFTPAQLALEASGQGERIAAVISKWKRT